MTPSREKGKTVVLTGVTGFIAKHVCLELLQSGYRVRGTLRTPSRSAEVVSAITPHLAEPGGLADRLEFVTLDLENSAGWEEALHGADALVHTASPTPLVQPDDGDGLAAVAVAGACNVLAAARHSGVRRVVMTSSVVAMVYDGSGRTEFGEAHWTNPDSRAITPYMRSKTLAEKAAWEVAESSAGAITLTTINPGFVIGPALDRRFGASLKVIQRMLRATDRMLPRLGLNVADVRDIASMHVTSLSAPETIGRRLFGGSRFMWLNEIAACLKDFVPERRISTRVAPDWVIRVLGMFDKEIRSAVPRLGLKQQVDNSPAKQLLKMEFTDPEQTIRDTAEFLLDTANTVGRKTRA